MSTIISRRDFLKATSAVGLTAAMNPASAVTSTKKSRVVIATDASAVSSNGSPNSVQIQDLVDQAIMAFTGKTQKASAYEALLPEPVTTSTKIFMKRNDASGDKPVNKAVTDAFQKGLESMLGGAFPKANIINPYPLTRNANSTANITAATYIINCPVAWLHIMPSNSYGVTLSLKNTMNFLCPAGGTPPSDNHSKRVNGKYEWLWKVSLDPKIKPKQVLSLLDAVVGSATDGPGTAPTFKAGTIIVGSDLVAVDYNAIRLLEKQKNAKTDQLAIGDAELKDAEAAGLGTCTEANMEIIKISPPWQTTGVFGDSEALMKSMDIRVADKGNRVEFVVPGASSKSMSVAIYDMKGDVVWQSGDHAGAMVAWNKTGMSGIPVPPAMYIYRIACGLKVVRGTVWVI